jgi:hypothetical protein
MTDITAPSAPPQAAFRRIRWMFAFAVIGSFTAAAWDGWWHTQYAFDGFFSPPHVMAYLIALLLGWWTLGMVLDKRLRVWFGAGVRTFLFPYPVPGALALLGGAVVLLGFAGLVLDNLWHSAFGLNETSWSVPHAMIGWALLLLVLGFMACRMALGTLTGGWRFVIGWLVCVMLLAAVTGPYGRNPSLALVRAEAQIPVFMQQPATQHLYRIYEAHNLTRTNPIFLLLAPLGAGMGLAFVRRMAPRPWLMLGVALLISVSGDRNAAERLAQYAPGLLENPTAYAPIPIVVLAAVYALLRAVRVPERWAWGVGGVLFALTVHNRFEMPLEVWGMAILGAPLAILGAWAGQWLYRHAHAPTTWRSIWALAVVGVVAPSVTGVMDLAWRLTTP